MAPKDGLRYRIFDFITSAIVALIFFVLDASTPFFKVPRANIADDLSEFRLVAWVVGLAIAFVLAPLLKRTTWKPWANLAAIFVSFGIWFTSVAVFNGQLEDYDARPVMVIFLFCVSVSSLAFLLSMAASTSFIFFWR